MEPRRCHGYGAVAALGLVDGGLPAMKPRGCRGCKQRPTGLAPEGVVAAMEPRQCRGCGGCPTHPPVRLRRPAMKPRACRGCKQRPTGLAPEGVVAAMEPRRRRGCERGPPPVPTRSRVGAAMKPRRCRPGAEVRSNPANRRHRPRAGLEPRVPRMRGADLSGWRSSLRPDAAMEPWRCRGCEQERRNRDRVGDGAAMKPRRRRGCHETTQMKPSAMPALQ